MWLSRIVVLILSTRYASTQEVQTANGKLRGQTVSILGKDVDVFYRIPYAKPPVGKLRFSYPQPPDSWAPSVRDATTPQDSCIQTELFFRNIEDFRAVPGNFSEDCLYVTVVSPSNNSGNLSVMFWIHGGGFLVGSPRSLVTEGHFLAAENNVIVVSVGYRLGVIGFSYISADTIPGNMGMMDQLMALKWTKANIKNFGGDPDRVTIFGESAGSVSVGLHLVSPLSKEFFTRAILQSGSPTAATPFPTISASSKLMDSYAKIIGCPTGDAVQLMKCLKGIDVKTLIDGQAALMPFSLSFAPIIDGFFLPDNPETLLKAGKYKHTQIINGIMKDEMTLFMNIPGVLNVSVADLPDSYIPSDEVFNKFTSTLAFVGFPLPEAMTRFYRSLVNEDVTRYDVMVRTQSDFMFSCPAIKFSNLFVKNDPVYMFEFGHISSLLPFPRWIGASHTYDIEFAFGFPLNNSYNYTQEEKDFSKIMMTYWTNFAKTGDPNSPSTVPKTWPRYEIPRKRYQVLDVRSKLTTKSYFRKHECAFINDILPMIPSVSQLPTTQKPVWPCSSRENQLLASYQLLAALAVLCLCFK